MSRWLIPLILTFSFGVSAQYGGVTLPGGIRLPGTGGQYPQGGQYPGGQYPGNGQTCPGGQYPVNGQCPGGQYPSGQGMPGMGQMLYGNLRQIFSGSLAMETQDGRVIQMQLARNARLYSEFGNARMSDFDPGDYITVQATQDMNGYYLANTVTETRKGTVQERIAAQQPLNVSMHDKDNQGQNGSQSGSDRTDSDSNRPVLHRAGDSSSGSGSASASDSSSSSDDGRPHMRRADSGDSDNSDSSSSSQQASQRPRMASSGDNSVSPQISPMPGDPGPPVMRRGSGGRDQNVAVTPPDNSSDSTPQRPTVRAQDVDGVTQVPTAPAAIRPEIIRDPDGLPGLTGSSTNDAIIDQAREQAFAFTETLPNYIVKQYTTRYQSDSASRGHTSWQALDIVTADVVAENGSESYKNVMVNGKATKDVEQTGSWSKGEFVSTLQSILSPASDALFTNKRSTTIVNRPAYRYDYSIEQPRSNWLVDAGGSKYRPAYGGAIWIDKETSRVLRIEMSGRNMPRDFALDQVESTVDYDFVLIGNKKFLLPVHSEALSCMRGTSECTRNVIEFRNYRKFGSEANITFDDPVK